MERDAEIGSDENEKESEKEILNSEDNPEELHGQSDAAIREEDKVSEGQDSEDVVKNKSEDDVQKDQEPNDVDDKVEVRDEEENDPGPPGEGALPVTFEAADNSSEECKNVALEKPTNQSRDSLEEEFLVQEMMTGDTMAQEIAASIPHPVTDTDDGDLEAPGEEEIEMLEEIPVISIRSGTQLMSADYFKFFLCVRSRSSSSSSGSSYTSRSRSRSRSRRRSRSRSRSRSRQRSYSSAGSDIQIVDDETGAQDDVTGAHDETSAQDDLGLPAPVAAAKELESSNIEKQPEENNSDDDILEVEVVSSGQKDRRGSDEAGRRKRERSSASSRSHSRQSSRSDGHQPDPKRRNLEVLDGNKQSRSSRWEKAADNTKTQGRNFVSHASWSFDTSRPPPNLQQNLWINRDQDKSRQGNRGRGQQFSDDRRNRGWNRGGGGGHTRIQTVHSLEDRSQVYRDNNQNTRHEQYRPEYGTSLNSQSSRSFIGDNQYRCNNSNSSDYYDHENGPHQSSGASSGDHHPFSETYYEQGDRFNYNDGAMTATPSPLRRIIRRDRPGPQTAVVMSPCGHSRGHSDDGDQTLRPPRQLS